jgi:hypothetical protein
MPELIYCAAGNKRFAETAIRYGFTYGAQMPNTVYFPPEFMDQDWRKPNRTRYMAALAEHRPRLATVLDWERDDQFAEVMAWAEEAAQYVSEAVIIIPKVIGGVPRIPEKLSNGVPVRLGYSVPTRFAGTEVPLWEIGGRPVHLLGGSPHKQHELARYLNVASTDSNYSQSEAVKRNQFFAAGSVNWAKNKRFPRVAESAYGFVSEDCPYFAFELSCMNIRALWAGCGTLIRWAVDTDIPAIQRVAYQYRTELGRVMRPALQESIGRQTLLVAEHAGRVVGFCNYRRCRDGVSVIYEIAVDRDMRVIRIGSGLLAAVPAPIRLKCTADNERANDFYAARGLRLTATESGKHRPLNVWNSSGF